LYNTVSRDATGRRIYDAYTFFVRVGKRDDGRRLQYEGRGYSEECIIQECGDKPKLLEHIRENIMLPMIDDDLRCKAGVFSREVREKIGIM
jgi:hypothetical protein